MPTSYRKFNTLMRSLLKSLIKKGTARRTWIKVVLRRHPRLVKQRHVIDIFCPL